MRIWNESRNILLAGKAHRADTPWSRLVGLLGRDRLDPDEGLIITHTRSIHMFCMRFAIDVIFVDKAYRVVGLVEKIRPFRMSPYFFRARDALELPAGVIERSGTQIGDQIRVDESSF